MVTNKEDKKLTLMITLLAYLSNLTLEQY